MYFLATTAIERFWDKQRPIMFLNEGCCRFKKREGISKFENILLPSIWEDTNKIGQCLNQVDVIYERVLTEITSVLNNIHSVSFSKRYWQIVIGRWLYCYIMTIYDRYYSILRALEMDTNLESIALDKSCFIIPKDFRQFLDDAIEDFYNLQMCSQIFEHFDKNFISKKWVVSESPETIAAETNAMKDTGEFPGLRKKTDAIVINMSYFSEMYDLMLINRAQIPVEAYWEREIALPKFEINQEMRNSLRLPISPSCDFEKFVINSISANIPSAYLEGYEYIKKISYNHFLYSTMPSAILSAVSFDTDEVFKQWAADCAEKGTKIVGLPHTVAHPAYYNQWELHMRRISDKLYVPGLVWESDKDNIKIMPSPKFCGRREFGNCGEVSDILFLSTNLPRYFTCGFPFTISISSETYFDNQRKFWDNLSEVCRSNLKVRLYVRDFGQDCVERWNSIRPDIPLEGWEIPLSNRIQKSKIVVCDNFQTTFMETLLFNKPVVLYWDYQTYAEFFHPEAIQCFEQLSEVGILHKNPGSAAKFLNQVYTDIDCWWSESQLQEIRKNTCKLFTGYLEGSIDAWVEELNVVFRQEAVANSLPEYFNLLQGGRIALLGVNEVSDFLVQTISKHCKKEIVGVIDDDTSRFGKYLSGIEVNSFEIIMKKQPDAIIISNMHYAKKIEQQLSRLLPSYLKIINLARDLPESVFRELLINIYGEDVWRLVIKNG